MERKKYVDKIVSCSICGKNYTEILCEFEKVRTKKKAKQKRSK